MAENRKNGRKSNRHFSLDKPTKRHFEIEKDVEITPTGSTKPAEAVNARPTSPQPVPQQPSSQPTDKGNSIPTPLKDSNDSDNQGGSKKWILIALVIVILGLCAYFLMKSNKSESIINPPVEQKDSTQIEEEGKDSTDVYAHPTVEEAAPTEGETEIEDKEETASSTIEQMAQDVWDGKYGNNPARRKILGSNYSEVQKRVNEMRNKGIR